MKALVILMIAVMAASCASRPEVSIDDPYCDKVFSYQIQAEDISRRKDR